MSIQFFVNPAEAFDLYQKFIRKYYNDRERKSLSFEDLYGAYYVATIAVIHHENVLGLLSIFKNNDLLFNGKSVLCFGYLECNEDQNVANSMFQYLEKFARNHKFNYLIGPLNGSTWNQYRLAEQPVKHVYLTERFHMDYYTKLLVTANFRVIERYESKIVHQLSSLDFEKSKKVNQFWNGRNLEIRNIDLNIYEEEITKIHGFCSESFQQNKFYTPISLESFLNKYGQVKHLIDPDLVFIAQENGDIVGLLFALPDWFSSDNKQLVVKTIAKKPGLRYSGITHILGSELVRQAKSMGYQSMIHAFMHTNNASSQISKQFNSSLLRTYALFSKSLINE
jgi:L-amino acid N-acyltransferase YncA